MVTCTYYPHPHSLPTRGREARFVQLAAPDASGSIVSLPLVGRDKGWGAFGPDKDWISP